MIYTVTLNPTIDRTIEVDPFKPFELNEGRLVRVLAAGKGVNVSRLLGALGVNSVATGLLGGMEASFYAEQLGEFTETDFVELDGHTRGNITIVDPSRAADTHIRERGPAATGAHIEALLDKLRKRLREGDRALFAGSLPPGVSSADLGKLMKTASAAGAEVYLDGSGDILRDCAGHARVIKPNVSELRSMLGNDSSEIKALLAELRDLRTEPSLVTCGEEGAYFIDEGTFLHACLEGDALKPVSTVGCGDAFLAGFLSAVETGKSTEDALAFAVACGGACLLSPTTDVGDTSVLNELVERVRVHR